MLSSSLSSESLIEGDKTGTALSNVASPRTLSAPLVSELQIKFRTARIAEQVANDLDGRPLVVVSVLKGSFMFAADLLRRLYEYGISPEVDFIRAASYGSDDVSSGKVSLQLDMSIKVSNKEVLLVDDIADTGLTLSFLIRHVERKGALRVRTCVLLDKPSRRVIPFQPDYAGFQIPNKFVVGYGIDFAERYRNLPYIACLEPESA